MPRTKTQFEDLRNRKIELIEETAMKCFSTKGFHSTSINYIAKEAGISTGLLYNYFPGKDDLLKSIYIKGIKRVYVFIKDKSLDKKQFVAFIEKIFEEMNSNLPFWKLYYMVISQPDILNKFKEYMTEEAAPIINSLINYFRQQGSQNPKVEAQLFFSIVDGICINYLINPDHYPLEEIKQKIIQYYEQ